MADQNDVRRIALSLPETVESPDRFAFSVRNGAKLKDFVWVWLERVEAKRPRVPRPDVVKCQAPKSLVRALERDSAEP